ncbi:hypothetical protein [Virgibacillus halotolerans]|uniref:hypothetical protein n=1 Tax=Virgibacillus halotolerans TaxID=1071053 RepID=UPI00195F72EB|nr:hypothetical protein [Virgibacillus halotolerans]
MDLQKQIHMYSLDTSAFYNEVEQSIHRKLMRSYGYFNYLKSLKDDNPNRKHFIKSRIGKLKKKLNVELIKNNNGDMRNLDGDQLKEANVISVFETTLTRVLGVLTNSLTEEILVIRAYYFEVLRDLIHNGFMYNGEKYIYFSSSAGQIRTKKGVWIKESSWNKHKNTISCGLSVKDINKQGGSNINKYLAYIALTNSASVEIKGFDIDKTIVVDDLETNVEGLVDYIDRDSYEIARKKMDVPIEHTDGAGMILPQSNDKSFMVRLPFIKGLLVPFPFDKFSEDNDATKVTDIYGKEWDIVKDDIQIIFTKSQFKMWKYYSSWDDYKDKFIKYNCQAAKLNEEEDVFNEAKLNYQMIQTLSDITDEELDEISQSTIEDIIEIGSDKETMLRVLGANEGNPRKNYFQKALEMYPELLNDIHAKQSIKDVKRSLVRNGKSGRINIDGKYTFICPDMYAFCEYLFLGDNNPKGLLHDGNVYCKLYNEGEVDVLRSPHLYREHSIKNNVKSKTLDKWFITDGIYTSIHDTISKMLQFDVDGDKALVVDDPTFVRVAKRNMKGIVPLYYEMAVAPKEEITESKIYDSLIKAFHANIGEVSNNITKIWNSKDVDLDVVRWLCMENNFIIDYAKTLYMPTRPQHVNDRINSYIKSKVPHFFIFAKDKDNKNVEEINDSAVNRLNYIIPNKRIYFTKVAGKFDYKMLMRNPRTKIDSEIIERYTYLDRRKKWLISDDDVRKSNDRLYVYKFIRDKLLKINNNPIYITDTLVEYLYGEKESSAKTTLWESFGDVLTESLGANVKNKRNCTDCNSSFRVVNSRQVRCSDCQSEKVKEDAKLRKRRQRNG